MGRTVLTILINLVFLLAPLIVPVSVQAQTDSPPPRKAIIIETYTQHEWWLLAWADNTLACRILTEDDGQPSLSEVQADCPEEVFSLWLEYPFCEAATNAGDLTTCSGYYLFYLGSHQAEREVEIELPSPSVSLSLDGCTQAGTETRCALLPTLVFAATEPLADHRIISVSYTYRGDTHSCEGPTCSVSLGPTPLFGDRLLFWAKSSYGDSTLIFEASIRVKPAGDGSWQVDILSTQWETAVEVFALEWGAFPPLGESPVWLSHPADASSLASHEHYHYLAGQLINAGAVDASACADGGRLPNGYASQCGLELALDAVISWQNRFDQVIFDAAGRHGLSPRLLKNLIARESQFWPGTYLLSPNEYGLARLTETGADTILMWNQAFFAQFCPQFLFEEVCERGYIQLQPVHQELLRGALSTRVNLVCAICEYGFDFDRTDYNIELIAQSLLANAAQVGQMLTNLTKISPGASTSYEDLWRFTLVNYNAGPGCLTAALKPAVKAHADLNWAGISSRLRGDCRAAIEYVEAITAQ